MNNNEKPPKRGHGIGYVVVALVFLFIGGFATYYVNESSMDRMAPAAAQGTESAETETTALMTSAQTAETAQDVMSTFPPVAADSTFDPDGEQTDDPGSTFPVDPEEPAYTLPPASEEIDSGLNYYNPVMDIAEKCGPAVVGVVNKELMFDYNRRQFTEEEADSGSGVVISPDGYIVTNYHVIESAITNNGDVGVILPGGEDIIDAQIIGSDSVTDIAVLKIDQTGLSYVSFGDSDALKVGELVVAIGNPLGRQLSGSVSVGYVSALNRDYFTNEGDGYIQTDAAINPGNSGGGLFNDKGELVGMPSMKLSSQYGASIEGLGFAIPSNQIKEISEQLISSGSVDRPEKPRLGVYVLNVEHSNYSPAGIIVTEVIPGTPAETAQFQMNDVITSVDGVRTETVDQLHEVLDSKSMGDTISVEVYRNKRPVFIDVTLYSTESAQQETTQQ